MSNPRLQRKRKPGRPAVHGARQLLARIRDGADHRFGGEITHNAIAYFLACLLAGSGTDDASNGAGRKRITKEQTERALNELDAMLRVRVLAAADVGAVYYTMREYVFRQPAFIGSDGELLPVLRKSFLGYGNAWRRELLAFDLEPEDVEPSLPEYLARKANGTGIAPAPATSTAAPSASEEPTP